MGTPKKQRKMYEAPFKRWDAARIAEERTIVTTFGLKNKREIAKVRQTLRKFRTEAKRLFTRKDATAEKEKKMLIEKLHRIGLLEAGASLDDVLGLTMAHLMGRRLQSLVYQKGLAHTPNQARQMIVHGHVVVGDRVVTKPSFLVEKGRETSIAFSDASGLSNPDHPIRQMPKEDKKILDAIKKKPEEKAKAPVVKEVAKIEEPLAKEVVVEPTEEGA